jgi:hypothetical protein
MKTPEKNQKKQGSSELHESKATADKNKQAANTDKGAWKNPDPTNPKRSPEKINEPYAKTTSTFPGNKTTKTQTPGTKKEKITNAGESEHHTPVNKGDYDTFEDEYEDFELDSDEEEEEEDEDEDEDEDAEANAHYDYEEEEDEDKQFRSQVPLNQKKATEQNKLHPQQKNKPLENKQRSALPSDSATDKNKKNPKA